MDLKKFEISPKFQIWYWDPGFFRKTKNVLDPINPQKKNTDFLKIPYKFSMIGGKVLFVHVH